MEHRFDIVLFLPTKKREAFKGHANRENLAKRDFAKSTFLSLIWEIYELLPNWFLLLSSTRSSRSSASCRTSSGTAVTRTTETASARTQSASWTTNWDVNQCNDELSQKFTLRRILYCRTSLSYSGSKSNVLSRGSYLRRVSALSPDHISSLFFALFERVKCMQLSLARSTSRILPWMYRISTF